MACHHSNFSVLEFMSLMSILAVIYQAKEGWVYRQNEDALSPDMEDAFVKVRSRALLLYCDVELR